MKPQKRIRGGKVRWVARYVGSDGLERSKTFELEKHAKSWTADREREVRRGEWIDPKNQETTIGELWAAWERSARSDGTRLVREHIGANLGRLKNTQVGRVRPSDIRDWIHELQNGRSWVKDCTGLAPGTVKGMHAQLSGCLARAVDDGIILKSPCRTMKFGVRENAAITRDQLLTSEQVWMLSDAAHAGAPRIAPHPTYARMIIVGAATGLRGGELAGLRIRSIDFLRREAAIKEQSKSYTSQFVWAPLKTESSVRVIPLPKIAIDALAAELKANPTSDRSMPVFRTSTGMMWSTSTIDASFRSLRKRTGLGETFTWHSLRHYYASTLIQSGSSVKTVQERLGHSSATTTLEVYAHLWPGEDERTRTAMDEALDRDRTGTDSSESESTGSE